MGYVDIERFAVVVSGIRAYQFIQSVVQHSFSASSGHTAQQNTCVIEVGVHAHCRPVVVPASLNQHTAVSAWRLFPFWLAEESVCYSGSTPTGIARHCM